MSNSKHDPDDFSMTTPSIRMPKGDLPKEDPADDWGKTNYNFSPKQPPPSDEWGKTAVNIKMPHSQPEDDFGKTQYPGQPRRDVDYGATQANIHIPRESYDRGGDYGGGSVNRAEPEYKATSPYFQLPESERAKYQNLPPAAPAANPQAAQKEKKGGIPSWLWASGGLLIMFLFAVGILGLGWYLFMNKTGFELTVKGAPPGSDIFVDGQRWNLSSADGSYKLPGLKANTTKNIEIKRPGYTCKPQQVTGEDGSAKEMVAQCTETPVTPPVNECQNIKDFAKAAKCADEGLNNLKDPFTVDDLLRAMNMYIINFPSGKSDIVKPEDKAFLQKAAGYIQKLPPNVVIEVGGHTDNVGNKVKNQTLSEDRAKSVKNALVGFGVKDSVLEMRGYGDSKPKAGADNNTEDGRFQNRRIEYSAIMR